LKKDKTVYYECTSIFCNAKFKETDEVISEQKKQHPNIIHCPECNSPMHRRVEIKWVKK